MPEAYLTIDDSPSSRTHDLIGFLKRRGIPALLFVRGDLLEKNPQPIMEAIQQGLQIGNHSYAHKPAGELGFEKWCADFEKCEALIDQVYAKCKRPRTHKFYRFPYIDRGDGVRVERQFAAGEAAASFAENETTTRFQDYLKQKGVVQPFKNTLPGYPADAADSLMTYTTADWMLTERHKGKHAYKTLGDLKRKIDDAAGLKQDHNHIVLMHDQAEIFDVTCVLIDHMIDREFKFLEMA